MHVYSGNQKVVYPIRFAVIAHRKLLPPLHLAPSFLLNPLGRAGFVVGIHQVQVLVQRA